MQIVPRCVHCTAAVYNMDFSRVVAFHREKNADITICMHTCDEALARTKGIARVHPSSGEGLAGAAAVHRWLLAGAAGWVAAWLERQTAGAGSKLVYMLLPAAASFVLTP